MKNKNISSIIFLCAITVCLTPFVEPPLALFSGFLFSQLFEHPFIEYNRKAVKYLLQLSVIGLGFGMNLYEAIKSGQQGFVFTISTISITLLLGIAAGKYLNIKKNTALLISAGTAICGGSAIAAISPLVNAQEDEISVSLGTVFILNAVALFIFPAIGHYFILSQNQFGLWAAVAIHDTSSVVGAAHKYGETALQIATAVKLERALWIIPLSFFIALKYKSKTSKINIPYFIFLFVIAMCINTFLPETHTVGTYIVYAAKKGLTLTLFLIGTGLTRTALKSVGVKPLVLGVFLWAVISIGSLFIIIQTVH